MFTNVPSPTRTNSSKDTTYQIPIENIVDFQGTYNNGATSLPQLNSSNEYFLNMAAMGNSTHTQLSIRVSALQLSGSVITLDMGVVKAIVEYTKSES